MTPEAVEYNRVEQRYRTLRTLIRSILGAAVAYFIWQAVKDIAGLDTSFVVKLLADVNVAIKISWVLTGFEGLWAFLEGQARRRKVEKMQARIKELELRLDPARTSSGLTTKGLTHRQDIDG